MNVFDFLNSLGTTQSIDEQFESFLMEGIQDSSILKAIFLQGASSGSGKDFVLDQILSDKGLVEMSTLKVADYLFGRNRINFNDELSNLKSKNSNELREKLALLGRNGIIINGTSDSIDTIAKIKTVLENIGYDTLMILVNVSNEVAQQRNIERGKRGGRIVPENQRLKKWTQVQENRPMLAKLFGQTYLEFDNSADLRNADPQTAMQKHQELDQLNEVVQEFLDANPQSEIGQMWMQSQLEQESDENIDEKGVEKLPVGIATNQAQELGLQYYGSGRYGKNKAITHRSVGGKLKEIPKVNETIKQESSLTDELNTLFDSIFVEHKPKLTLLEVKERQQTRLKSESIYSGESGTPMNGYSMEVNDKVSGKAKPKMNKRVNAIQETTTSGDALSASISSKKEDELKKVGIDLATFKSKRHIG